MPIGTMIAALAVSAANNLEITVYNQGFAVVKEARTLQLKEGRQNIAVEDVAALIDPTSVGFKCISNPLGVSILEQNYQYDLISPMAILSKSVGKKVRLIRTVGNQKDVLEGTLISSPNAVVNDGTGAQSTYNGMVIRTSDGRIVLSPTGEVEVMELPEGLISKPTLMWDLTADKTQAANVELSYITQGMSWNASYVLTLDGAGKADLQGWVTLNNQSGVAYENAKLKLLAGEVNQVPKFGGRGGGAGAPMELRMAKSDTGFQEESLFEYHLYTLGRPATLKNKETKQLSLLEGKNVPVKKRIIVDSLQGFSDYYPSEGEVGTGPQSPQVRIDFVNDKASNLGMPLPAGKIRLYQRDKSGSVQMLGEDMIRHTPKDENVSVVVGRSFDIVSERKRTNYKRLSNTSFRETFEIELRNRKDVPETVTVIERHWGDWKVTEKSEDFTKISSNAMQFTIALKANEVRKVAYTVETHW